MAPTRSGLRLLTIFSVLLTGVSSRCKPRPNSVAAIGAFRYQSCWADDLDNRVLNAVDYQTDDMTVEKCADWCKDYLFFGVENGRQCFCGNELRGGQQAPEKDCGMLCVGKADEWCGGPSRLNLYAQPAQTTSTSSALSTVSTTESSSSEVVSSTVPESTTPTTTLTSSSEVVSSAEPSATSASESVSESSTSTASESSSSLASESSSESSSEPPSTSASDISSTAASTDLSSSSEVVSSADPSTTSTSESSSESSSDPSSTSTSDTSSTTTTSSETVTSAAPESSASLTTPSPTAIPSSSSETSSESSEVPSSTSTTSTTTQGPDLTTITTCPSTSTVAGPEQCYTSGYPLPYCTSLTAANFNSRALSTVLANCKRQLATFGNAVNPVATACFPTSVAAVPANSDVAKSTATSVYNCLQTASIFCTFASDCITKTYPVGEVPSPTPTIGVDIVQNGGFESGFTNWTVVAPDSPNFPQQVSSDSVRTGNLAYVGRYLNINGQLDTTTQVIKGLEPGKPYVASLWYLHTNPSATTGLYFYANPGGFSVYQNLNGRAANVWTQMVLSFTPVSSWVELKLSPQGIVTGNTRDEIGKDNIFIDDVTLKRLA